MDPRDDPPWLDDDEAMDIGPEPEPLMRECPYCNRMLPASKICEHEANCVG